MDDTTATTVERAATALGTALQLVGVPLPTSARNQVVRAVAADGRSVIVKRYLEPEPFASGREPSALSALGTVGAGCVPRMVAETPDLIVLEDLGEHDNVADALIDGPVHTASEAVRAWATGLGAFHAAGRAAAGTFRSEMVRRTGACSDYTDAEFSEAAQGWPGLAANLGVETARSDFEELARLPGLMRTDLEVLSAGDMCPDNNLLIEGRVVMIDLEFATLRHLAWDVAYLQVPWPSCWCAWTLPETVVHDALVAWRTHAAPILTDVDPADLEHDLRLAADGWRWLSSYWLLQQLSAPPRPHREDRPSPRHQDRVVHSLLAAADSPLLPELGRTARDVAAAVTERFDATALAYPAAFG